LDGPRIARRSDRAEGTAAVQSVRPRNKGSIRLEKICVVEAIKCLASYLEFESLAELRRFAAGEVDAEDSGTAHIRKTSAEVPKGPGSGIHELCGIEPLRHRAIVQFGTLASRIRTGCDVVVGAADDYREPAFELLHPAELPAAGQDVQNPIGNVPPLIWAERQLINNAGHESLGRIVGIYGAFGRAVVLSVLVGVGVAVTPTAVGTCTPLLIDSKRKAKPGGLPSARGPAGGGEIGNLRQRPAVQSR
jgi:hypothetical protein